jgi:hypothetical protein
MVPSMEEASRVMGPYFEVLRTAIRNAINYYMSLPAKDRAERLSNRSRASIIYDSMKVEVIAAFDKLPNPPHVIQRRGQLLILIGGKFLMKLKKLDKRYRPSYIPTQTALRFMTHNQDQPAFAFLDDIPPVTNVIAGYVWNESETEADVYVVCPQGKDNAWKIPLSVQVVLTESVQSEKVKRKRQVVARSIPVAKNGTGGDQHG